MYLIDTHTHIFSEEFDSDIEEVINRAIEAGVRKFCLPNVDIESIPRLNRLCERHPEVCFPMMGLHPTSVKADYQKDLDTIWSHINDQKFIAIGEIGIDLYWDKTFLKEQTEAFEEQLRWSIDLDIPVAIHTREAFPQVFESLNRVGAKRLRGIFHSFGGSLEEMETALAFPNFSLGINGVVTYKKAQFPAYLATAPLSRIVLETDAPYLPPVPYRGKRNEPSYLLYIVQKLAEVYGVTSEEIAKKTTENAESLFVI